MDMMDIYSMVGVVANAMICSDIPVDIKLCG